MPCLANSISYYYQLIVLSRELSNFEVTEGVHEVIIQYNTLPGTLKLHYRF